MIKSHVPIESEFPRSDSDKCLLGSLARQVGLTDSQGVHEYYWICICKIKDGMVAQPFFSKCTEHSMLCQVYIILLDLYLKYRQYDDTIFFFFDTWNIRCLDGTFIAFIRGE